MRDSVVSGSISTPSADGLGSAKGGSVNDRSSIADVPSTDPVFEGGGTGSEHSVGKKQWNHRRIGG